MAGDAKEKPAGIMGFVIAVIVMAVVGAGAGFSLKYVMPAREASTDGGAKSKEGTMPQDEAAAAHADTPVKRDAEPTSGQVMALEPILINLAEPKGVRLRLESAVLFAEVSKVDRSALLRELVQDLAVFLRTVKLAHLETASGVEYLREDISEIVQLRSKGHARGIVIKSLMVE